MTKNPFINALAASLYIAVIASFFFYVNHHDFPQPDSALIPMFMLSLFVLSAALMGYIFLYQPLVLFLEGKQKQGVTLFLQTVGCFAVITLILLATFFFVSV